ICDEPLIFKGNMEFEDDKPMKYIVNSVQTLKEYRFNSISAIHLKINPTSADDTLLENLKSVIQENKGECPVYFHVQEEKEMLIRAHPQFNIIPSDILLNKFRSIVGKEAVSYSVKS
ncbi:MAG: hypothetical protein SVR08_06355, partial [Spirochaetota bacterium]|nr:hypothetical protein [Spirochaetota bacterium]